MDLVNKDAGLILEEKDLTEENLITMIDNTINDKDKLLDMKKRLKGFSIKDSSSKIYEILKDLILNDRKFY